MTSFLRAKAFLLISAVLGVHLASCSTPNVLEQDTTNTIIIIENMRARLAGRIQQPADLLSDICSNDSFTEGNCTVAADFGVVEISATLKNPNQTLTSFFKRCDLPDLSGDLRSRRRAEHTRRRRTVSLRGCRELYGRNRCGLGDSKLHHRAGSGQARSPATHSRVQRGLGCAVGHRRGRVLRHRRGRPADLGQGVPQHPFRGFC